MKASEFSSCARFLDEWPEDDKFEQVLFKVCNWDDAVAVKADYEDYKRPELVCMMRVHKGVFEGTE